MMPYQPNHINLFEDLNFAVLPQVLAISIWPENKQTNKQKTGWNGIQN